MLFKKVKERLIEETERFYEATKNEKYRTEVQVAPKMNSKITTKRNTKNTIKWRAKLY